MARRPASPSSRDEGNADQEGATLFADPVFEPLLVKGALRLSRPVNFVLQPNAFCRS